MVAAYPNPTHALHDIFDLEILQLDYGYSYFGAELLPNENEFGDVNKFWHKCPIPSCTKTFALADENLNHVAEEHEQIINTKLRCLSFKVRNFLENNSLIK